MNFCTYFDSNYLLKGLVCHYTLCKYDANLKFYIICLDDNIFKISQKLKNVIPIKLSDIEKYQPKLLKAKNNRDLRSYYTTLSPIVPLYIFDKFGINLLFYTDADMMFCYDVKEIKDVMGSHSLMVTDHGFEPPYPSGRFNVGILGYRNDKNCKEFLKWWEKKCLNYCSWEVLSDGSCSDQGYLNILHDKPNVFKNFLSCPHPGINLGGWILSKRKIEMNNNELLVNGKHLICYHAHGYNFKGDSYDPSGWPYSPIHTKLIFDKYFELMKKAKNNTLFKGEKNVN